MEERWRHISHVGVVIVEHYLGGRSKPRPYEETTLSSGVR